MDRPNQDFVSENCVCNDAGELALTDEERRRHGLSTMLGCTSRIWVAKWRAPRGISVTACTPPSVSVTLICKALDNIKFSKASGEEGVELARQLEEELHPGPLCGQGRGLRQLSWSQTHRSSQEANGMGVRLLHSQDDKHRCEAVRLCA